MSKKLVLTIAGCPGVGKSTIGALMRNYLKTLNIDTRLHLENNELPPCPTDLRKNMKALVDAGLVVEIVERNTVDEPKLELPWMVKD